MVFKVKVSALFQCSLKRAFKTPLLCDVTKVHTGYGIMPRVTHTTEDDDWGQPGASKKVFVAKSRMQKGGFASVDTIIERVENKYWKFQVDQFQYWILGFDRFVGEWQTLELLPNKVFVEYTYSLHAHSKLLYPLNWLFVHTFWKTYMKRVLHIVKNMAYTKEPYQYK